jgi:hypothetical protein
LSASQRVSRGFHRLGLFLPSAFFLAGALLAAILMPRVILALIPALVVYGIALWDITTHRNEKPNETTYTKTPPPPSR